jgi:hypothetical protein
MPEDMTFTVLLLIRGTLAGEVRFVQNRVRANRRIQETRESPTRDGHPGGETTTTSARTHSGVSRHRSFLEFLTERARTHVKEEMKIEPNLFWFLDFESAPACCWFFKTNGPETF